MGSQTPQILFEDPEADAERRAMRYPEQKRSDLHKSMVYLAYWITCLAAGYLTIRIAVSLLWRV